ncbi:unnamed protein product [Rhizoctonia solani]|uniref:Lysine-specific metallo-endopeptidase domain-containing protein n=1 Tax=Rhizoctonia solani TaxID=456999 RepID=A0A8H3HIB5_9AGAM|nr:unnamed protein product [Rhizoctonia solani]
MRTAFAAAFASLFVLRAFAEPALTTTLSQPDANNPFVKTTVTNTGSETLKILKDPQSVLSETETETFTVTGANGSPNFRGIRVKYSPDFVRQENDPESFIVLAPGQSHEVTHDLSRAFDFGPTGTGEYRIEALNTFNYVDATGQLARIIATTDSAAFKMTGNTLPTRDFRPRGSAPSVRQTGTRFNGCSPQQQRDINAAIPLAEGYITQARTYLDRTPDGLRYKTWFGQPDSGRLDKAKMHFQKIQGKSRSTTYDCSTCTQTNVFAYVYPNQPGKVYLCPQFWRAPTRGSDSKAGTLVHEQSHFDANGGTQDYAYSKSDCRSLARRTPETAVMNADNHEYFAENDPNVS